MLPFDIDPDELFALLLALYWACLAGLIGAAIVGIFYWTDTLRHEQRARRNKYFGGV